MISNDTALAVTREALADAEAALASVRARLLPDGEAMYAVVSESYIDLVNDLRAEIDAYLGTHTPPEPHPEPLAVVARGH